MFMQDDQLFMAEIGVMRKLSHPYIVHYLGCGMLSEKPANGASENPKSYIAIVRFPFPPRRAL
jgi:serine/threonine protein kinase